MQIADGRKTVESVRAGKAESIRQLRARASSLRSEENAGDVKTATTSIDAKASKQPAKKAGKTKPAAAESTMVGAKAEPAATKERRNTEFEEKLRAAEIKVEGLESEVEELKAERDRLRERVAELEAALNQRPSQENAIAGDFKIRTNRGGADYLDPGDIPVCLRRAKP
jgi:chromosome segregation ATPase